MAGHQPFNNQRPTGGNYDYPWDETAGMQSIIISDQSHTAAQSMYETQNSTQMSDFSDAVPQPIHPLSGFSDMPNQTSYLSPNSSQTRPQFPGFGNVSAAPVSISPYLFPVYQAFEENERPTKQQIYQIAREAGIQPHDVYMFSKFVQSMRQKLGRHSSPPHGLITPDHTQEVPDGHSSTGVTTASRPAPASLELPKDPVGDTIRPARDDKRQCPNQRHSRWGKRPRSADRGQGSGSALEEDHTNKRQLVSPPTEVTAERLTEAHGPFECVSCSAEPMSVWRYFCNHEDKCHFPATYFKCQLCDYQCAKADNGKTHLKTATDHRQYEDGEELDEMYASCLLDGRHMFHDACGFNDCQATFTTRKASRNHIRVHIKRGCKRSEWTHRCKTRHRFCLEFPTVEGARRATRDQDHLDDNDDGNGGDGNGDADGHADGDNEEDEADEADEAPDDDDDDTVGSGAGGGGATDSGAPGDSTPDDGDKGPKDADSDHALIQDDYGNMFLGNSWALSRFGRQTEARLELTHAPSRMRGEHRSRQIDSTDTDPRYRFRQTTYQKCLPCREKVFEVKVKHEYYAHVPGYTSSGNSKSDVIAFRFIRTLGQGGFGTVDEVENPCFPGKTFALKTFKQSSGSWSAEEMFSRERDALEMVRCGHPHLIDFLGSGSSGGRFGILMSPVADMDLDRFLRDYSQGIFLWARIDLMSVRATQRKMFGSSLLDSSPKKWVTSLLEQMRGLASAISHIHDMKPHGKWRWHGDIKPSNILVLKQRDGWNFRLTDLGCASFAATASTERSKPLAVTPMYCAPECYKYTNQIRQPDRSIDIWSLGCVYLEILTWTLGIPIEDFENFRSPDPNDRAFCSKQDQVKLWLDKLRERAKYKEFSFPYHSLFDTISKMMSNNPDDRPTAKEVHSAFPPNSCVDVPGEGSDVTADSQLPSGTQGIDRTLRSDDTARKHVIGLGKRTILRHNVRLLINGRPVDAVPDTGSDQNVISSSLAFQLNLVIDPGHKDLPSFQLADRTEVQPIGTVELDWALVRLPEKTFSSVFYVMKDISTVVLGWPTLDKLQLFTMNRHLMETRPANTDSPPRCLRLSSLTPTLKCNIASRPEIAILDTGCDVDLVSHEFVLRRRLILKRPSPDVERIQLANGKTVSITGRVKLKCEVLPRDWDEPPMKTQRVTFHVMPELNQDILLGNGFFSKIRRLKTHLKKYHGQPGLGIPSFSGLVDRSDGSGSKAGKSAPDSPGTLDHNGHDPPIAPIPPPPIDPQSSSHQHKCRKTKISLTICHQAPRSLESRNSGHDPPGLDSGQRRTHMDSSGSNAHAIREAADRKERAAWPNVLQRFGKSVMQQARAREGVGGSSLHGFERSLYVDCCG